MLGHPDLEEHPTIARLKNIKTLAEGVKTKSQTIADNLYKDTEHLHSAINKANFVLLRPKKLDTT